MKPSIGIIRSYSADASGVIDTGEDLGCGDALGPVRIIVRQSYVDGTARAGSPRCHISKASKSAKSVLRHQPPPLKQRISCRSDSRSAGWAATARPGLPGPVQGCTQRYGQGALCRQTPTWGHDVGHLESGDEPVEGLGVEVRVACSTITALRKVQLDLRIRRSSQRAVGWAEHELAERLRGLSLHAGNDERVDAHRESDRGVPGPVEDDLLRRTAARESRRPGDLSAAQSSKLGSGVERHQHLRVQLVRQTNLVDDPGTFVFVPRCGVELLAVGRLERGRVDDVGELEECGA